MNRTNVDSDAAPDRNDEYRFYQILVGTWAAEAFTRSPSRSVGATVAAAPDVTAVEALRPDPAYLQRVRDYMIKAIKEAKVRTSWINDNKAYDAAMAHFVDRTLTGPTSARFLAAFFPLARRVAHLGVVNSLAQLVLKIASPGVPDFYQGNELWDLHLVDPDNRQPVDYEHRIALLDEIAPWLDAVVSRDGRVGVAAPPGSVAQVLAADESVSSQAQRFGLDSFLCDLLASWPDGRIKLFLTAVGLRLRRALPDLFLRGAYVALEPAMGATGGNALAFARRRDAHTLIVAVPRLVAKLVNDEMPVGDVWGEAKLLLPDDLGGTYRNLLTGDSTTARANEGGAGLKLADAFRHCPVALLWRQEEVVSSG
jgi:(1->4)-alpha-D-glucan 1-alpha-D-glucosylmutase